MRETLIGSTALWTTGSELLRRRWGWYVALGFVLAAIGVLAVVLASVTTVASVVVFGWLLLFGGILEGAHAFRQKDWGGFFLDLLTGILYSVVGFMVVANPGASAIALTLLIAMFLVLGGLFRIVAALAVRYPSWGIAALHGVVSLALGIMIWRQWPVSGLWVIGLFVGIEMIMNGITLATLGIFARRLPDRSGPLPPSGTVVPT
jgi:uncharacterized membrane protein HdeD (DUF308 family)